MKRYYLAYGSNLNIDQLQWRCPDARALGTAEIADYRLLFKGSGSGSYLTIEQQNGGRVPVAVWEVSEADERRLDRYEGFPTFYYKKEMPIVYIGLKTKKRRKVTAFVYIMHEDRPVGLPSVNYLDTCLTGYYDFGFDRNLLRKALCDSEEELQ
jgi:hypothetical protein